MSCLLKRTPCPRSLPVPALGLAFCPNCPCPSARAIWPDAFSAHVCRSHPHFTPPPTKLGLGICVLISAVTLAGMLYKKEAVFHKVPQRCCESLKIWPSAIRSSTRPLPKTPIAQSAARRFRCLIHIGKARSLPPYNGGRPFHEKAQLPGMMVKPYSVDSGNGLASYHMQSCDWIGFVNLVEFSIRAPCEGSDCTFNQKLLIYVSFDSFLYHSKSVWRCSRFSSLCFHPDYLARGFYKIIFQLRF